MYHHVVLFVTPRFQGPSRKTTNGASRDRDEPVYYLNVLLLTANTIYIHIFYFLQSMFLEGQSKKNWLDSWLTRG